MRFRNVLVIVNPASGQTPVDVEMIKSGLAASGAAYKIVLTEPDKGPKEIARAAAEDGADLVIAVGGDGTVLDTAEGLIDTGAALGVIPAGTANVFSAELGIPNDAAQALDLILGDGIEVRQVDVGVVGGKHFLLRVGIGLEAAMTVLTEPALKNRFGIWAYLFTVVRHGRGMNPTLYKLKLDGKERWVKGVTCVVCNSGNLGISGVKLIPEIDLSDGYLNVVVITQASLRAALSLIYHAALGTFSTNKVWGERKTYTFFSISAREVTVEPIPRQIAARDGEEIGSSYPLNIAVKHKALRVAAPKGVS